ncbi:TolC family protein [Altericista sp. CCNU0014]|uniref:TolC family protein n=1 Tax=Altericista sp. CCNU0014 TaxID=3082949 RepID=UPI00384EF843
MSSVLHGIDRAASQTPQASNAARRSRHCRAWICLAAIAAAPLSGTMSAFGQPPAPPPVTCDPNAPLPQIERPSAPTSKDLGSLPPPGGTSGKAADLSALTPPSSSLQVPSKPEDVAIKTTQSITLDQAIDLVQRRNRDLQIAALQVEQQRFALRQARASIYPTVSTNAGITRTDSAQSAITAKQLGLPNRPNASNNFNGSVQLNYDVFTSGQRSASIRSAEAALRSSEKAYQTQLRQVRLDVANDYYDLQQADESIKIAQQAVENAEENLRVAQARETAGLGTRFDVLQAQVLLADRRQQLIQAQNQQQVSRRQLAQRLTFPETVTVVSADPVAIVGEWPLSLEDSIVQALRTRSELAQVLDQRDIALQNRRVALGSLGPQLTFNANVALADDLADNNLGAYGYGVGAEASKTIFDGGAAKAIATQQQLNASIAETQFGSFKNVIRFQVEQNYYTLQASRERIGTTRCAIEQAEQGLNLARLRRDFGVGTSLEVSNATTDLAQARNNYLSAIVSYNRALSALRRFVDLPAAPQP